MKQNYYMIHNTILLSGTHSKQEKANTQSSIPIAQHIIHNSEKWKESTYPLTIKWTNKM